MSMIKIQKLKSDSNANYHSLTHNTTVIIKLLTRDKNGLSNMNNNLCKLNKSITNNIKQSEFISSNDD
jgi:hypothetical protein